MPDELADQTPQQPADSAYHRTLPIGERLSGEPLVDDPLSSFEEVRLRPLAPMLVPEAPRSGTVDRAECGHCRPSAHTIWTDGTWQVRSGFTRSGLPFVGGIAPVDHVLLDSAPVELLAGLGPLMQRISAAVKSVPGVARCHFSRWGDGSEHFHLWALARPAGMMQGRGPMLAFWDDVLPDVPDDLAAEHRRIVAENLARGGGEALAT
ncbi:hypothetical protein [Nocardioides ochotonae]|uniref:hypothetical protein n=1 Tax=Nocardioides ochotonae TaxID=2685869 RepID=UPI00140CA6ED|nr:hypothetical protein [Nocardioides ochotonae]